MKHILSILITLACPLGLMAIGSPSDFTSVHNAAEMKAMKTTGMTNPHPTMGQIARFISDNPVDINRYSDIYNSSASVSNPYRISQLQPAVIQDGVNQLNIARYIAGVYCHVASVESCNEMAAKAALICAINKSASHDPQQPYGMDDALYKDAHNACTGSNLGYGYKNIASEVYGGWLCDREDHNLSHVGHRLWCLAPNLYQVGFGMAKNGSVNYNAMYYQTRKYAKIDDIVSIAWPAQNMPVSQFSQGSPFSFSLYSADYKVQLADEITICMLRRKDNRFFQFRVKKAVQTSDGVAYVHNGLADCKTVIWGPTGFQNMIYTDGDEYDVYIAGFYVDGKPYPVKYTIHFFDSQKVSPSTSTQSAEANYAMSPIRQTTSIHGWDRSDMSTSYQSHTWDLSDVIVKEGNYTIRFNYSRGGNMLCCHNAVIRMDGTTIATFPGEVTAGNSPKSFTYTFNVNKTPHHITLTADIRSDGGTSSEGYIDVRRNSSANNSAPSMTGSVQGGTSSSSSSSTATTAQLAWHTGDFTTSYQTKEWDLTQYFPKSGNYSITFTFTNGSCMLACRNARIVASGATIATFPDEVTAGFNPRSWTYTFNEYATPKQLKLIAEVRTVGGTNSNGTISIVRNGYTRETGSFAAITTSNSSSVASSSSSNSSSTYHSTSTSSSSVTTPVTPTPIVETDEPSSTPSDQYADDNTDYNKHVPKMTRENYWKQMTDINDFSIFMPEGYDPITSVDVPLVIFLHGRSMSQDLPAAPEYGPAIALRTGYRIFHDQPVLLVCPSAKASEGWSAAKLHRLYEFLKDHYAFDHQRFYIVGLSMGGWGTLNYVNRYPDEVAACIAICGGCDATSPCGLNKVPTWIIHAQDDDQTSVTCSDRVVNAMKECGTTSLLQYSRLESGGHSLIHFFIRSNTFDWLLSHRLNQRSFNRTIDFVDQPDYDIDELHFGLYEDDSFFITQDTDITPELLATIRARHPNAQGSASSTEAPAQHEAPKQTQKQVPAKTMVNSKYMVPKSAPKIKK